MEYAKLGNTDIEVSKLCIGCMSFGKAGTMHDWTLDAQESEKVIKHALDLGINFFDTANCYSAGTSEEYLGQALKKNVARDKVVIASKVYFNEGRLSKAAIEREIDGSLKRLGTDYLDLYIIHRFDFDTPIEETMGALADIVRQGKALYVGISNYDADQTRKALAVLKEHKVPCLIHQARYSMFDRWTEPDLLPVLKEEGVGMIAFSPLAQGLLTDKYLRGIPENSRAAKSTGHLQTSQVTPEAVEKARKLNEVAARRGQTLAEMALAWLLKDERVTSVLIGASSVAQLMDNLKALDNISFSGEELQEIENILI